MQFAERSLLVPLTLSGVLTAGVALAQPTPAPSAAAPSAAAPALPLQPAPEPEAAEPSPPSPPPPPSASPAEGTNREKPEWLQQIQQPEAGSESHAYVDKGDSTYPDVVAGWGWRTNNYKLTASVINYYLHDEDDVFGFHGRVLGLGAVSYNRRTVVTDGPTTHARRTRFVMDFVALEPRLYYANWGYVTGGLSLGAAFYDGMVPTADVNGGFGFGYAGWGIELGVRTSRLPDAKITVNGEDFIATKWGGQLYLALETNLSLLGQ